MPSESIAANGAIYIGRADQIPPGEGRSIRAGDTDIAVFRSRSGEVLAVQASCPHLGGPLADGITSGGRVTCPMHGYVFELATGLPVGNGCEALRTFAVQVSPSGDLLIDPAEMTGIPD